VAPAQTQITFAVATTAALPSSLDVIITAILNNVTLQTRLAVQVVSVAIAPGEMSLSTSHAQQFTATVTGASDKTINWSVQEPGGGSINTTGLYTAPATVGTFHVLATSVADPSKKASAIIHVTPKPKDKEKEKEKERVKELAEIPPGPKIHHFEVMPAVGHPIVLKNGEAIFDPSESPTGRAFIRPAERPETTPFNGAANP
jgi:hypothetical protein